MPRFYDDVERRYGDKGWLTYISEKQILQRFQPDYVQHRITASLIKGADRGQMRPVRYVGDHKTHAAAAFWAAVPGVSMAAARRSRASTFLIPRAGCTRA